MTDDAPLELHTGHVLPEWIDYNGHMNVAYYILAFDHATDAFLDYVGLDQTYKKDANCTTFVVDMNVCYKGEVREGDALRFTTQVLDADEKRLHYFHRMYHAEKGYLAATNEIMTVHISLATRRVAPMRADILSRVEAVRDRHESLPVPEQAGRLIAIKSKN
jgi:acyl-CoA thioester hydrolase